MHKMDQESRGIKAEKIVAILRHALGERLTAAHCLDLGCGIGVIATKVGEATTSVIGLEPEREPLIQGPASLPRTQADGLRLPFADGTFDVIVCAQVYEHVPDADRLAAEIYRALRPGGTCFFSGPNRLWPYEYHYGAVLIHWLPERWQSRVLRLLGRDDVPIVRLRTSGQLRRLWSRFAIVDYTPLLVVRPELFPGADTPAWARRLPMSLVARLSGLLPNMNWVLEKPYDDDSS